DLGLRRAGPAVGLDRPEGRGAGGVALADGARRRAGWAAVRARCRACERLRLRSGHRAALTLRSVLPGAALPRLPVDARDEVRGVRRVALPRAPLAPGRNRASVGRAL